MKSNNRRCLKVTISAFAVSIFAGAMASAAMAQAGPNPVSNFDYSYLDQHPEIAQQISANPRLVDNPQYMSQHPGLQQYFASHPEVAHDIKTHPYNFMRHEDAFLNSHGIRPADGWANEGAVGRFDQGYLHEHPEVAQQLASNPGLLDNPQYIASHPGLREYLDSHPGIRQDMRQHPYAFMKSEDQLNGWHPTGPNGAGYVGPNRPGYASPGYVGPNRYGYGPGYVGPNRATWGPGGPTDNFLMSHPEINEQLNRNPRLVDNPQYVASHPGLEDYLKAHPEARQEWRSHPYIYMHRADRLDGYHNNKH